MPNKPIDGICECYFGYSMTSCIGLCFDMKSEGPGRCDTFAHDMMHDGSSHDIYGLREVFYRKSCFDDDGAKMMKCGMREVFLREGATGDKHVLVYELD